VDRLVTIVEGDAHKNIAKFYDPVDFVFIDADKAGYVDYLKKVLPLVRPGGLILAHNVDMAPEYMKAVTSNPLWKPCSICKATNSRSRSRNVKPLWGGW
jgi:predicted O-methyltransferase YrrM